MRDKPSSNSHDLKLSEVSNQVHEISQVFTGAKLETELKESEGPEQEILHVDISAPSVIPDGLVVALQFEVLEDMNINHEIALDNLSQTAQSVDGQE